jgi:hypothetical protein
MQLRSWGGPDRRLEESPGTDFLFPWNRFLIPPEQISVPFHPGC